MTVDGAEARLRKWLTDDSFQALLISVEGRSVGYILYQLHQPTPDIRGSKDSIYVRQFYIIRNARRFGHGKNAIELLTHTGFGKQSYQGDCDFQEVQYEVHCRPWLLAKCCQ